jgi:hypothetical protein
MAFSKSAVCGVLALCAALPVCASTIISTGVGPNGPSVYASQYEEQGWTQTQSYVNVSIQVALYSWTPGMPFDGTAYLTESIGLPATLPALDSVTFSGVTANTTPETITLFSGLSLGPGTYYLTLASTDDWGTQPGAIWDMECSSCSLVLDSGVTLLSQEFANAQAENVSYAPGSSFTASNPPLNLTVTGNLAPTSSPEPSGFAAVLAGLALAPIFRRRLSCRR